MEQEEGQYGRGFDLVLKELINLHEDASKSVKSKDSNHRSGFDLVLKELMTQREQAAVAAERAAVAAEQRLRQQSELMAEREKAAVATALLKQQNELMAEREKAAVATALLKKQDEMALMMAKQQNDFQLQLQKQQDDFQAKLEKLLSSQEEEKKEERRRQEEEKKEERARHVQERRDALQQQESQHIFFRGVIQQLQDEVKVLRHNENAHLISGTQGEIETPGKHGTTASSSPYSMTPLSLMMETPNKLFEDTIGGGEVIENFAAGDSGSVDETNNYVENDAIEEEEPTSIIKSDQGSVVLSDEDQRAKGFVTFEEAFLLNKSDKVGNKVENAKGNKLSLQKITTNKSRALRDAREKMKMLGGKQKLVVMLICEETSNMDQKEVTSFRTIASRLG